jgi:hypothetical protein
MRMTLGHLQLINHPREPRRIMVELISWFKHLTSDTQIPAYAIKEVVVASTTLSDGLFKIVNSLLGFQGEHKFKYYTHLVANPDTARAFMNLQLLYKIKCMGYGLR